MRYVADESVPNKLFWVHTHGLTELGGGDVHIVQLRPGESFVFLAASDAQMALAGKILDELATVDGALFPLIERFPAQSSAAGAARAPPPGPQVASLRLS